MKMGECPPKTAHISPGNEQTAGEAARATRMSLQSDLQ